MFNFCLSVGIAKGWDETKTSPYWCSWQFGIVHTTLLTAGQWAFFKPRRGVSAEKSNAPIFVPQRSPVLCSPLRENWPALVQSFALWGKGAPRDVCALHRQVSAHCETICPWLDRTCRWLCSGDPRALCLWPSAQPKSRSNTCEKQWRSTANEIPLNCNKITKRLLHRFQEEKDALSPKMRWISEAQVKHPLKTLNLTWIGTRDWGPCLAYLSFILYLVLKSTQKTKSPSHSLQQQWSQGRGKYKAGRSPANSFCYLWK